MLTSRRPGPLLSSTFALLAALLGAAGGFSARSVAQGTPAPPQKLATVRHAAQINGRVEGSVQQLTGESVIFNSGAVLTGDFLVPGTPTVQLNGTPNWQGRQTGTGSTSPAGWQITLNSGATLRYLVNRTDPVALPTVPVPPTPAGTRLLTVNSPAEANNIGNWATVKDLTLNSGAGNVSVPAGTYGVFNASNSDNTGFVFGVANSAQPTVYNLQQLTLNSNSRLTVLGPVIINVKGQVALNSNTIVFGSSNSPGWVTLNVSSAGVSINSGAVVYGAVNAPVGRIDLNGKIVGTTASDYLTVNSGGVLQAGAAAPVNKAPVVDAGSAQTITLPVTVSLAGKVTDDGLPQGAAVTSTWTKASGPGTVAFSNAAAPATSASFSQAGTYVLTLTASDTALSGSASVTITVNPANQAPVVSAGANQAISLPASAQLSGTVTDDGLPPGAPVTSTWSKVSGPGTVAFANAAALQTTASFSAPGAYALRLSASDTRLSSSADVTITVSAANQPPVVSAGAAQTIALPASASLQGTATDDGLPAGGRLTVAWSQVSGPGAATFSVPAAAATQAGFPAPGAYVLRLSANDGQLTSASEVTVTVSPQNQPPTVSAGPAQTVRLPASATLAGSATDDGLPNPPAKLTLVWSQLSGPGTATFSSPAAATTGASFDKAGAYVLRLSANDGALTSTSDVSVTVSAANQAPVVGAGANPTITLPATASLGGTVTDDGVPEGAKVTSAWTQVSGPGTATFASASSPATTATFDKPGTYALRLSASDTQLSSSADVTVTVLTQNQSPQVSAGPAQTIQLPAKAALSGTVTDDGLPTGGQLTQTWSQVSGPGTVTFSDPTLLGPTAAFSAPGTYVLQLTASDLALSASAQVTVTVQPVAVPDADAGSRFSRGTDFWLAFPELDASASDEDHRFDLLITAEADTNGTVSMPSRPVGGQSSSNFSTPFRVKAGQTTTVHVPANTYGADLVTPSGIHVTAEGPVNVCGFLYWPAASDAFLALPTHLLDTDHLVLAYSGSGSQFAVVATADGTVLTITPMRTIKPGGGTYGPAPDRPAGQPYTITLDQGQVYELRDNATDGDVSGTVINSNLPVAVFGGHQSGRVPADKSYYNSLIEQVPPTNLWGSEFLSVPLATRRNGDTFRFLACADGTQVSVNGLTVATLNRGQFYERIVEGAAQIAASQPILIAQYSNSVTYDAPSVTSRYYYGPVNADPSMMLVTPRALFSRSYTWTTPVQGFPTNYVNVVTDSASLGAITLDGAPVPAGSFTPIGSSGFAGAQLPVSPGAHRLAGPNFFGALAYGFGDYDAYSYPAGLSVSTPMGTSAFLGLSPAGASGLVGQTGVVAARLLDAGGAPLAGVAVAFQVVGVNPTSATMQTDSTGQATFRYPATKDGADLITVSAPGATPATASRVWAATAPTNQAPAVDTGFYVDGARLGTPLFLAGSVSDDGLPAGSTLSIGWSQVSGPGSVAFADPTQPSTTVTFSTPGTYTLKLTASDGSDLGPRSAHVEITVLAANHAPTVTASPASQTIASGTAANLAGNVSDDGLPTGSSLRTSWVMLAGPGYVFFNNPRSASTSATFTQPGVYTLDLSATDSDLNGGADVQVTVLSNPAVALSTQILPLNQGAVLQKGQSVSVAVAATDPSSFITRVELYLDDLLIGESRTAYVYYSFNWIPSVVGTHQLTAKAYNQAGVVTPSAPVPVTISTSPTVRFVQPAADAKFLPGDPINIVVDAQAPDSTVREVHLSAYPVFDVQLPSPSYTYNWVDAPEGDYSLTASVTNAEGLRRDQTISISVHPPPDPAPLVQITSPANGAVVMAGEPITFAADAVVPGGKAVRDVVFTISGPNTYQFNVYAYQAPYQVTWTPQWADTLTIYARAEAQGNSTSVGPVRVTVTPPPPLGVRLTAPLAGASVPAGQTVTLAAEVSPASRAINGVSFYADGVQIGGANYPPYTLPWDQATPGDHTLTAVAYGSDGQTVTSTPVQINVQAPVPVILRLLSPTDGKKFNLNSAVTLAAAVDSGAEQLASLKFFANSTQVGSGNVSSGASVAWTPTAIGSYQLQVVGCDAAGNTLAQSATVTVQVANLVLPTVLITNPTANTRVPAGTASLVVQAQASGNTVAVTSLSLYADGRLLTQTPASPLSYSWSPLSGGRHELRAVAIDAEDQQGASAPVQVLVDRTVNSALAAPAQLTAQAAGSRTVQLAWSPPPAGVAVAGTTIERRAGVDGQWAEIAVAPLNFDDQGQPTADSFAWSDADGLQPEYYYSYRVAYLTAEDASGARGLSSSEASDTTTVQLSNYAVIDLGEVLAQEGWAARLGPVYTPSAARRAAGAQARGRNGRTTRDETPPPTVAPVDLGERLTALWMATDGTVLLRVDAEGSGHYLLRKLDGTTAEINEAGFIAHRLSRDGTMVAGESTLPTTIDNFGLNLPHTQGVVWKLNGSMLVKQPVTSTQRGAYRYPKNAPAPSANDVVGLATRFSDHQDPSPVYGDFPSLDSVWDVNAQGQVAAALTVYHRPRDTNGDGQIDYYEARDTGFGALEDHPEAEYFDANNQLLGRRYGERGNSFGLGSDGPVVVDYTFLSSSAARLTLGQSGGGEWTWLGPLTFAGSSQGATNLASLAKLIGADGTVVGYAARPFDASELAGGYDAAGNLNIYVPTHAFVWKAGQPEYQPGNVQPALTDLGVLAGGLHSQPEAINAGGEIVGSGDTQVIGSDGASVVPDRTTRYHGIFWQAGSVTPVDLGSLVPSAPGFPVGYSRAYDINDQGQVVGESVDSKEQTVGQVKSKYAEMEAVLWQKIVILVRSLEELDSHFGTLPISIAI